MATHFKGPILFSAQRAALENLNIARWNDQFIQFDDYDHGAIDETLRWTIVKDSGAAAAIVADARSGELNLTSANTTDNDGASIQGKQEYFSLPSTAGNKLYYETRIKMSDVDQMDVLVGLTETFTTNPENALASSNIIGFLLTDGSAVIAGVTEASDTATTVTLDTTLSTLTNDTYVTLGFVATKANSDGNNKVDFYINRKYAGTSTTNIPTANMKMMAMSVSGDATGQKITTLDYMMGAQDRDVTYSDGPA
jgi:hypothetical protein|tara:strand:- start:29 stop:787 length:759 start_codon:yes stop_codon:yes gene_type:complete